MKKIAIILSSLLIIFTITFAAIPEQTRFKFNQQLNDVLSELMQKLNTFNKHTPEDRVYLHFDKTLYKPGETIWFSVYVRDGKTLKASDQSDMVNIQLINPKGAIIKSYKVIAQDGIAKGDFQLSEKAVQKTHSFTLKEVVEGSLTGQITFYPSTISNLLGGIEGMIRQPNGCFEQTSSSTYPNVIALRYMQEIEQGSAKLMERAEKNIRSGYQRFMNYESNTGGFSWYGNGDAYTSLSAYGLICSC